MNKDFKRIELEPVEDWMTGLIEVKEKYFNIDKPIEYLKFARWSTKEDSDIWRTRIEKKKKSSQVEFLQSNKNTVIKLHDDIYKSELDSYVNKLEQRYLDRIKSHSESLKKYEESITSFIKLKNDISNGEKINCDCGGIIRYIERYNFFGCSNYTDSTQKHFTLSYPYEPIEPYGGLSFDEILKESPFEINKNYLSMITKQLPVKVKASDLYEFLVMNNISLHRDDITYEYFRNGVKSQEVSKKREDMIGVILSKKFPILFKQKLITYQFLHEKFIRFAIPDFIAYKKEDNTAIIFEQKKNVYLINNDQIKLYIDLLHKINKDIKIKYYIIVEENYDCDLDLKHAVLTLTELENYEF